MKAYGIQYTLRGDDRLSDIVIDARDIQSAKRKIARKHGYKDGRIVKIQRVNIIGYF